MDKKIIERFWSKIDIKEEHECWEFKNQPSQIYAVYTFWENGKRKSIRSNRYTWIITNGPIPEGVYVCHSCDNPKCCNPKHLWLGTNSENILDRIHKFGPCSVGHITTYVGEIHHSSKLTERQVLDIRARVEQGERQIDLAREHKVSKVMISKIILRKSWKHI